MWLPGEAFVDSANGISVGVLSATSQGFVVTVTNGTPDITVSPLLLDYGNVAVGTKGAGKTVTVRNDGVTALVPGTLTLAGLNPDQFKLVVAANLCDGRTLAAGQSCTVRVKLSATTAGLKTATLRIPSSDPDEAVVKVNLNGTASSALPSPEITVTPASVPFGNRRRRGQDHPGRDSEERWRRQPGTRRHRAQHGHQRDRAGRRARTSAPG